MLLSEPQKQIKELSCDTGCNVLVGHREMVPIRAACRQMLPKPQHAQPRPISVRVSS